MRGLHKTLIAFALASLAITTLGLVDCAAPTQIVVEVRSDACPNTSRVGPSLQKTGIAVGTSGEIDEKRPAAFRDQCEDAVHGGVGTLTIYPSGSHDAEVAIKVVAGVDVGIEQCDPPDYAGCIVHRRVMRFIPNTSQRITVRLSLACLSRVCPKDQTCDNGVCKNEADILADGGTKDDAAIVEAGLADGATEPRDAGGPDACAGCKGVCSTTGCAVDCKTRACDPGELCSPTLPCNITCDGTNHCNDIRCTTSSTCTVSCGMPKDSCNKVTCSSATCDVTCIGSGSCDPDGGVFLDASTKATLTCSGDTACGPASCSSPDCNLSCDPKGACPSPSRCTGGCTGWNAALN